MREAAILSTAPALELYSSRRKVIQHESSKAPVMATRMLKQATLHLWTNQYMDAKQKLGALTKRVTAYVAARAMTTMTTQTETVHLPKLSNARLRSARMAVSMPKTNCRYGTIKTANDL